MKKSIYLFGFALVLSILLVPERVAVPFIASYPQARVEQNLKPEAVAMVPVPVRKPELNYSVFKGLSTTFAGLFTVDKAEEVSHVTEGRSYKSARVHTPGQKDKIAALTNTVKSKIKAGQSVAALKYFRQASARSYLDGAEHDQIQSRIAASFLYEGKIVSAGKLAMQSADRSGAYVPQAGWIAGLALWQQGKYDQAAIYFEKAGKSSYASSWMASAGSFWAYRAHERAGNPRAMMVALQDAAKQPRTFYGLMAKQALGQAFDFNWNGLTFNAEREAILKTSAAGARAMDLVAQKRFDAAEKELLNIAYTEDPELRDALLSFASHAGLAKLSFRLGSSLVKTDGAYYDAALYPVTPWEPKDGFTVDPALVHAVMRQESKFDVSARSPSGAVGLMQVLPTTANYVARNNAYKISDLNSPQANLEVGQDYLEYLLKDKNVDGDVLMLLVAYNAGPGNLAKWKAAQKGNTDPLLFIEMIPVNETREYVEHVMTNFWMYRLRDGKDVPTLKAVSAGKPAKYAAVSLYEGAYALAALSR